MKTLAEKAAQVVKSIKYMNIASITTTGLPWNSPVYFAVDNNLNFYWHSWKENQHSMNIAANSHVFVTIYDSTVPEGTGFGVYMQGKAYVIEDPIGVTQGLWCLFKRIDQKPQAMEFFLNNFPRRVYKFVPAKLWVNGDGEKEGEFIDVRSEIDLQAMKLCISQ